jgi:hypothetical protein
MDGTTLSEQACYCVPSCASIES